MKMSRKSAARQRAIRKTLAAGKSLGGLVAGLFATVVSGCSECTPANTMGSYPAPNATREAKGHRRADVMGKMLLEPEPERANAQNEVKAGRDKPLTIGNP